MNNSYRTFGSISELFREWKDAFTHLTLVGKIIIFPLFTLITLIVIVFDLIFGWISSRKCIRRMDLDRSFSKMEKFIEKIFFK